MSVVDMVAAPLPDRIAAPADGPVIVAGFLRTATGLGESARLCLRALRGLGYEAYGLDLSGGPLKQAVDIPDYDCCPAPVPDGSGTLIVHVNGPVMGFSLVTIGRQVVRNKRVIGYWAYELPDIPDEWRRGLRFVDELWVPSRFVAQAMARHTDKSVRVVHHPVEVPSVAPVERRVFRKPDGCFMVLTAFNAVSGLMRKNPVAAVRAFKAAFGHRDDCLLVLKAENPQNSPVWDTLLEPEIRDMPNVKVIGHTLDRDQMSALIAECDVLLSLHRSEGFGLILAEALLLGKPVVATGWSGNADFLDSNNSLPVTYDLVQAEDPEGYYDIPGQLWAEPRLDSAVDALQTLRKDDILRERLAKAAYDSGREFFDLNRYGNVVKGCLPDKSDS